MPAGPGVRVDSGIDAGDTVPADYDNLVAKVMVHAQDRDAAIHRLRRALDETEIGGIQTTLPFHRSVARSASFRAATLSTDWVADNWDGRAEVVRAARVAQIAAGLVAAEPSTAVAGDTAAQPRPAAEVNGRWRRAALDAATDRWPR
jgi:acetyl/propionyl-CoA carboxylase alpha subunit